MAPRFVVRTDDKKWRFRIWDLKYDAWVLGTGQRNQVTGQKQAFNTAMILNRGERNPSETNNYAPDARDFTLETMDGRTFKPNRGEVTGRNA